MLTIKRTKNYEKNRHLRQSNPNIKRIVDGEAVSFHRDPKEVAKEQKLWEKEQKAKKAAA